MGLLFSKLWALFTNEGKYYRTALCAQHLQTACGREVCFQNEHDKGLINHSSEMVIFYSVMVRVSVIKLWNIMFYQWTSPADLNDEFRRLLTCDVSSFIWTTSGLVVVGGVLCCFDCVCTVLAIFCSIAVVIWPRTSRVVIKLQELQNIAVIACRPIHNHSSVLFLINIGYSWTPQYFPVLSSNY